MNTIDVSRNVDAPAAVVWRIITDLEGSVGVISAIEKVEILSGDEGFGVGTTWRETRTMFGRQATEVMEITELTEGESYATVASPDGANYRSVMAVASTGDATCSVSMEFGANPKSTMTRLMGATVGRMFTGTMRKAMIADLDDIAAAAEAAS
jgi:uncharacterized membrane protein